MAGANAREQESNLQENEEVSQENDLQEPDGEQNPELPEENEYLVEENHEQNAVPTQLDNSTDTDSPETGDSPDRPFQSGRKRVRIEDDEDGSQQFIKVDAGIYMFLLYTLSMPLFPPFDRYDYPELEIRPIGPSNLYALVRIEDDEDGSQQFILFICLYFLLSHAPLHPPPPCRST
jgi:hypothetical protein